MASSSRHRLRGSTSVDSSVQWKYDVFLSFRGSDTRKKFTDHLYDKLQWHGLKAFRDDPDLERGAAISPELLAAIGQSRFAVVVLSPDYASSSWCLLELVKIVACMGDRGTILPVFYEVDPCDVRHQIGSFADAFAKHEDRSRDDPMKVQEWRDALKKVADLSGWTSKDYRYETELIKEIVDKIWNKVHPTFSLPESEALENLVGVESKLMQIEYLLETESNDVSFIGIWGMGGIGKTTLARLIYQRISQHFEVGMFLTDVRQVSATHGLVHVQEQLLCQILKEKNVVVRDVYDGITKIKRCLINKKVLLVIDDVDQLDQLEKLAGDKDWFGPGSIIIVTTRDQHLLVLRDVEKQYKCKGLNEYEALQLFSWKAFKKYKPEEGYRELSESIVDYARGLPLALKILGSFLYKRDQGGWESTVAKLKKAPIDQKLFEALRISYDGLDEVSQQVFLDIAGFLKGNSKERVIRILDNFFGFDTRIMLSVLVEKSLLSIVDNCVDMHDLIQEMGREIIRLVSEPGQRSRLWLRDDIFHVLKENRGTEAIRSMVICLSKMEELAWNPNAFSKMSKLKFLKMQNLFLSRGPEYLPDDIRVLEWDFYPSIDLPPNFHPVELTEIILHHSKIHQLWRHAIKLEKLTVMDLSHSENLRVTPDFTGMPNLERLVFEGCTSLVDIHPSITSLRRLEILNLKYCRRIRRFPAGELEMNSLELIDLSGCSKVSILPQFLRRIQKLLESFVSGHHRLSLVLASLRHFSSLKELHLNDCKLGEGDIPDDIGCLSSLESLDLSVNNFVTLPDSISQLSELKFLNLDDCKSLEQFPCLPASSGTCHVTADNCISLKKFVDPPEFSKLWKLSFSFINCCGLEEGGNFIPYSMLQQFLQEPPPFYEIFHIVIPGNHIPPWFTNQREGNLLREMLTECAQSLKCGTWAGFAFCVLIEGQGYHDNSKPEEKRIIWDSRGFNCDLKKSIGSGGYSFNLNQTVFKSDHICVFLLPPKHFRDASIWESKCYFDFIFRIKFAGKEGLRVKRCGVRALHKYDIEVFDQNREMNQSNQTISARRGYLKFSPFPERFSFVIPGKRCHVWFPYRYWHYSKLELLQPCPPCRSTMWIGWVFCVIYEEVYPEGGEGDESKFDCESVEESGPERREENQSETENSDGPQVDKISCCWKRCASLDCSCNLEQVVNSSDHLCIFFIPSDHFQQDAERLSVVFRGTCSKRNVSLRIQWLYHRRLDKSDVKTQPNTRVDQSNQSMSQKDRQVAEWVQLLMSMINGAGPSH